MNIFVLILTVGLLGIRYTDVKVYEIAPHRFPKEVIVPLIVSENSRIQGLRILTSTWYFLSFLFLASWGCAGLTGLPFLFCCSFCLSLC